MLEELVKNLVDVKQSFAKNYSGNAHIQEVIPTISEEFMIYENHLEKLHEFARIAHLNVTPTGVYTAQLFTPLIFLILTIPIALFLFNSHPES